MMVCGESQIFSSVSLVMSGDAAKFGTIESLALVDLSSRILRVAL